MRKSFTILLLLIFGISEIMAGGYQVRLQGHRQTSMGLVGVSLLGDASNIFYNPAGITQMNTKYSLMVGASGIFNKTHFSLENSVYKTEADNPMSTPFYFYGAAKFDKLAVGIGVYTPYGSTSQWDEDWVGNQLIQKISMRAIYIQPTVSYKINDLLSLGAGFVIVMGGVELDRAVPYGSTSTAGQVHLDGNATSYGFNAGVTITPNEKLNIGVDYRSHINMKVEGGDAKFTVPASVQGLVPEENKFSAELPLPANLDAGVSYQVNEKLMLAFELNYVFWGVYDSLSFEFEESGDLLNSSNPREYSDRMIFRLGGEYVINDKLVVRAGAYYDPTPTNEDYFTPETVSLNTIGITCGITYKPTKNLGIDISYLHLETFEDTRSYTPDYFTGTYNSRTMIPGIGVSYNF